MRRLTDHPILSFRRGKKITFNFEGQELTAYEGETIAVALHANGIKNLRKTPKRERDQGFFCAIGKCSSCLMEVNGIPNVRTCITRVKEGMSIRRQRGRGEIID
ncbi:MAG: (2Fe-2S)-binding protein [Kosmotogaceae bacterium]